MAGRGGWEAHMETGVCWGLVYIGRKTLCGDGKGCIP